MGILTHEIFEVILLEGCVTCLLSGDCVDATKPLMSGNLSPQWGLVLLPEACGEMLQNLI